MIKAPTFTVLILAAGCGNRFGQEIPKQYALLHGKPVLRHTIERFIDHPTKPDIYVVIDPQHENLYRTAVQGLNLPQPIHGGKTRKDSCYNGLQELSSRSVIGSLLVHDGARPFITPSQIDLVFEALKNHKSVTLGMPVSETLRRADEDGILDKIINRDKAWTIQTPQGFDFKGLCSAHEKFQDEDHFTDDCSVMEAAGYKTKVIPGSRQNIKITWTEDLEEAKRIMMQNQRTVIGQGFDVHAFGSKSVENIRLGGIDVPHNRNLQAHSDGDVVLHAITDAVLGAIGKGDIGLHFPPSDDQWKDKDSRYFLEEAANLLQSKGGRINNLDVTIICERPKLTPVRNDMVSKIAEILDIPTEWINVKATTTEQLGFTGREEGIACQASVCATIVRYDDTI